MAEVIGIVQIAVPLAIEGIKGMSQLIKKKLRKRKESRKLRDDTDCQRLKDEDTDSQNLEDELQKDLDRLSSEIDIFQKLLQGVPDRLDQDPVVQEWCKKLQEIMYDAEDLLDEYAADVIDVEETEADDSQEEIACVDLVAATDEKTKRKQVAQVAYK